MPCLAFGDRPAIPDTATELNGVAWGAGCYKGKEKYHVFIIGDWGGMCGYSNLNDCDLSPEESQSSWDHDEHPTRPYPMKNNRGKKKGIDDSAQHHVRDRMNELAAKVDPEFVLNVGDNFYPGGIVEHCQMRKSKIDFHKMPSQFKSTYEEMYNGKGLRNKEWLSVLGNHDYGGVCYNMGWGQQIFYTWNEASTKRWIMPAQYYSRQARFETSTGTVTADMWFLDTNIVDTRTDPNHDICSQNGNSYIENAGPMSKGWYCAGFLGDYKNHDGNGVCAGSNYTDWHSCNGEFARLWSEQLPWLEEGLKRSTADWQILVTHYPAHYPVLSKALIPLAKKYGIDLIVTGHTHEQKIHAPYDTIFDVDYGATARVVSGGGGGIFSEGPPSPSGHDDAYGFMDLVISREELVLQAYSWASPIERIVVSGSDCDGSFSLTPWERNGHPFYSTRDNRCSIVWDNQKDNGKVENGWALVRGQDSQHGYLCLGGRGYKLPGGSWRCRSGGDARVKVTRGAPFVRRSVTVKPVLPSDLEDELFV